MAKCKKHADEIINKVVVFQGSEISSIVFIIYREDMVEVSMALIHKNLPTKHTLEIHPLDTEIYTKNQIRQEFEQRTKTQKTRIHTNNCTITDQHWKQENKHWGHKKHITNTDSRNRRTTRNITPRICRWRNNILGTNTSAKYHTIPTSI